MGAHAAPRRESSGAPVISQGLLEAMGATTRGNVSAEAMRHADEETARFLEHTGIAQEAARLSHHSSSRVSTPRASTQEVSRAAPAPVAEPWGPRDAGGGEGARLVHGAPRVPSRLGMAHGWLPDGGEPGPLSEDDVGGLFVTSGSNVRGQRQAVASAGTGDEERLHAIPEVPSAMSLSESASRGPAMEGVEGRRGSGGGEDGEFMEVVPEDSGGSLADALERHDGTGGPRIEALSRPKRVQPKALSSRRPVSGEPYGSLVPAKAPLALSGVRGRVTRELTRPGNAAQSTSFASRSGQSDFIVSSPPAAIVGRSTTPSAEAMHLRASMAPQSAKPIRATSGVPPRRAISSARPGTSSTVAVSRPDSGAVVPRAAPLRAWSATSGPRRALSGRQSSGAATRTGPTAKGGAASAVMAMEINSDAVPVLGTSLSAPRASIESAIAAAGDPTRVSSAAAVQAVGVTATDKRPDTVRVRPASSRPSRAPSARQGPSRGASGRIGGPKESLSRIGAGTGAGSVGQPEARIRATPSLLTALSGGGEGSSGVTAGRDVQPVRNHLFVYPPSESSGGYRERVGGLRSDQLLSITPQGGVSVNRTGTTYHHK